MAAMPIYEYGKNSLKIIVGCRVYQVPSNDDPRLTLRYLTLRSNFLS